MKETLVTYVAANVLSQETDENGNTITTRDRVVWPNKKFEKEQEAAKKNGKLEPELCAIQTFNTYNIQGDEEFAELVPDESERANLANRALDLKQQMAIRDLLMDAAFAEVEGAYDLKDVCGEIRERRKASPVDKALKLVADFTPEELEKFAAMFASASQTK